MLWKNKDVAAVVTNPNIESILSKTWSVRVGFKLALNMNVLKNHFEVYSAERDKIISHYGKKKDDGTVEVDENGRVKFATKEDADSCIQKLTELDNIECELATEIIYVTENDIPEKISPMDFIPLTRMLIFENNEGSADD